MGSCYILESRKKNTQQKFENAGPYIFDKKNKFGDFGVLKRANPNLDLRIAKIDCPRDIKFKTTIK